MINYKMNITRYYKIDQILYKINNRVQNKTPKINFKI